MEYLLNHKAAKVRVLDDFSTGHYHNIRQFRDDPAFEFIEGDIRDAEMCNEVMRGMDYVLHQAALGSVPRSIADPAATNDVNITGFLNILTAAKDEGIKRMVYAASSSTYGDSKELPKIEDNIGNPLSPYAVTKLVNELYGDVFSKIYHFHATGLRYFNVFGPRQNPNGAYAAVIPLFIRAALSNEIPTINGDGFTNRDFTFIDNVVQANIKALLQPGVTQHNVFNIACGQQTNLNELWQYLSDLAGTCTIARYATERTGDVRQSLASIEKAAILLRYTPEIQVKQGLKMTYEWYQKNDNFKQLVQV